METIERPLLQRFRHTLRAHRDRLWSWLTQEADPATAARCGCDGAPDGVAVPALAALDDALARLDHGTFGRCTLCDGAVEPERLALDFTTCICLDHYSDDQRRDLERDLEMAARVQQLLFPGYVPALAGFDVAAHAHPARILSGDYYDFFYVRDQVQGFVIADVMGKGVPAAMLMANLQASLRILGPEHASPDELAARLNTLFQHNLRLIRFITLCLVTLEVETGVLRYCNAGHNPPLLREAATGAVRWLEPTGPALGLSPRAAFQSASVTLQPGDVLVLYTDGLVEARREDGDEFGTGRLVDYVERHHDEPAERLLAGLHHTAARFAGGRLQDDVALVVLKRS